MSTQIVDAAANAAFTDVVQQSTALAALNATNTIQLRGQSTCTIQVTAIGSQTLTFEASTDGTNFTVISVYPVTNTGIPITTTTATGHWQVVVAGFYQFRVRCSVYTSGSATVSIVAAQGTNEQQVNTGVAIASTTAGQVGPLVQGAVTTAAPAYTTAQTDPLSLSTAGGLRTDLTQWGDTNLGTPTNFGTGPGAVIAGSVNASIFTGTTAVRSNQTTTATGVVDTNIAGIIGVTAVAASAGVLKTGISGATGVTLDSASAATFPTNMLAISGKAQNVNPTAVANAQAVAIATDLAGRVINTPLAYRTLFGTQATTLAASTETTIITAGAASVFRDLVSIIITTAGAAAATITIRDVTAGGTPWIIDYPNAAIAPGAPFVVVFGDTPLRQGTAASAWTITNSVATTTHITCQYVERIA